VVLLLVLGLLWGSRGEGDAQSTVSQSSVKQHVLYLKNTNTGQHVAAKVGELIQITLQTIGPGEYELSADIVLGNPIPERRVR